MNKPERLFDNEGQEFAHFLIAQLDAEGHKYQYWYERFMKEVIEPQMKAEVGSIKIYGRLHERRCFKAYNPSLKMCHSLCNLRVECQKVSKEGYKRCVECSRPAISGRKYCYYHQAVKSKNEKRIRRERVANGLCMGCGKDNDNKHIISKVGKRAGRPLQLCSKCREHIRNLQLLKKSNRAYIHPDLVNNSREHPAPRSC